MQYFANDGKTLITQEEWTKFRANEEYRTVRKYENHKIKINIEWLGSGDSIASFRSSYALFAVKQYDMVNGEFKHAPESGKTFSKLNEAIEYYETVLFDYTNSHYDEEGEFIEEGNKAVPPKPKKPKLSAVPATDIGFVW